MSGVMGRSGIEVSEIGFGCWAIGGPFTDSASGGIAVGWRGVDEAESAAATGVPGVIAPAGHRPDRPVSAASGGPAGRAPELLARLGAIREVLTCGGRTLAQGALGWLLAR